MLVQRKEPKKHAPAHCARRASCASGPRQRSGSADCTSCATAESARSLAPPPAGPDRPLPPQCHGAQGRAKARESCAQKLWLLILGPRQPRRGQDGTARRVERRDAREFANGQDAHRANPGLTLRTAAGSAAPGVHFFWLLFFVQAKKSDPLARMRAEKRRDAVRAESRAKTLDSSFRWNDELHEQRRWIPASAGMTS